jgi:hypothetical protein
VGLCIASVGYISQKGALSVCLVQHLLQQVTDWSQPSTSCHLWKSATVVLDVGIDSYPAAAAGCGRAQAIDVCTKDSRLRPFCDTSKLILMGHSRGAKLSCLISEQVSQPCCGKHCNVVTDGYL